MIRKSLRAGLALAATLGLSGAEARAESPADIDASPVVGAPADACAPRGRIPILLDEIPEAPPTIEAPWSGRDRVVIVIPAGGAEPGEPATEERSYFPMEGEEEARSYYPMDSEQEAVTSPLFLMSGEARDIIPPPPVRRR